MPITSSTPDEPAGALVGMLHALDDLYWPGVRAALAERVTVDYRSLFGGQVEQLSSDDLITRWRGLLPGFDATQHHLGPVLVVPDGDGVRASAHVRGYHRIAGADGGPLWTVAGQYVVRLAAGSDAWMIKSLTLRTFYEEGNRTLLELASRRATTALARRHQTR